MPTRSTPGTVHRSCPAVRDAFSSTLSEATSWPTNEWRDGLLSDVASGFPSALISELTPLEIGLHRCGARLQRQSDALTKM
jgi:hypothetical protein